MNFSQLAKERYSVRKFSDRKIEPDTLKLILEAGQAAPTAIRESFHIPEAYIPVALLPLGYSGEDSVPHPLHEKRYDLDHTVFFNSFPDNSQERGRNPLNKRTPGRFR